MASVGDRAPDFTLTDQHGQSIALSSVSMPALIVFIPAAFTPVCHDELRALRSIAGRVRVLVVACDSMYVLRALDEAEQLGFPLLSDFWPHGETAKAYGVFLEDKGFAIRGSFVVDKDGIVRWAVVNGPGEARNADDYAAALAAL